MINATKLSVSHEELLHAVHNKYLAVLTVNRFIITAPFEQAYLRATEVQRLVAIQLIEKLDKRGLDEWTRTQLRLCDLLEIFNLGDLRKFAKDLEIPYYSVLTRFELINAIRNSKYEQQQKNDIRNHAMAAGNAPHS